MEYSEQGYGSTSRRAGIAILLLSMALTFSASAAAEGFGPPFAHLSARAAGPGEEVTARDGSRAELVTLDAALAPALLQLGLEETARIADWPVAPGVRRDVLLTRHEVYAPDARIFKVEGRRTVEQPRSRLAFYWGAAEDDPEIRVFASVDPGSGALTGFAQTRDGLHELHAEGLSGRHRVANPEAFLPAEVTAGGGTRWSCGEETLPRFFGASPALEDRAFARPQAAAFTGIATATVAIDTDNELMLNKFTNNTTAATNYLASLFATMDVMYERDLMIRLVQGTTFLRVSTTPDPYSAGPTPPNPQTGDPGGNASGGELTEFSNYWSANEAAVPRALAAMISGKQPLPPPPPAPQFFSASGIASLHGLCDKGRGYSFSQVFAIDFLTGDAKIVGHEIGHNFGSPHTHCYTPTPVDTCYNAEPGCFSGTPSCPAPTTINGVTSVTGTIMSYCHLLANCSQSLVFHPRTVTLVNTDIANAVGICILPLNTAPAVTAINPKGGATAGGTPVTITGANFQANAAVSLGGVAASSVQVVNGSTITAVTGAHAGGLASLTVTNPGNGAGTLSNAYFYNGPGAAAGFFTVSPCRVLDTRNPNGALGGPALAAGTQRSFHVAGVCGIPASAQSISVNVTVTGSSAAGSLSLYPGNAIPLGTSTINFTAGRTLANNAMLLLATDGTGTFTVQNAGGSAVHFILDVNGYFQ